MNGIRDHQQEMEQQSTMTTISRASQERQTARSTSTTTASRKSSEAHRSEVHIDSERGGVPPDPFESSVHGREVHVAKQKQTQKEVKGQLEITRKITATETTEVEHKARTQERVVQGQVVRCNHIFGSFWIHKNSNVFSSFSFIRFVHFYWIVFKN